MDNVSLNIVLKQVQRNLKQASDMLHDTGEFESKELDAAMTEIEKAMRQIDLVIGERA
jgi:mannitol/fructose-specific phosphotransferase system IIA component (Ntr-type)